jgi:tetratricopeptide (TPR) repeat protein
MIELLIQAEQVLSLGLLDEADRLYRLAAESDPNNAIAVVGLSRVALERGDEGAALALARQALVIDPESSAAGRMRDRLEEVIAWRGEAPPDRPTGPPRGGPTAPVPPPTAPPPAAPTPAAGPAAPTPAAGPAASPAPHSTPPAQPSAARGLLRRLTRRS